MSSLGMDLNTQQRNAVRELLFSALGVWDILTDEQKASSKGQYLLTSMSNYERLLPNGPQPFDAAEPASERAPVGQSGQLSNLQRDILTVFERKGPLIDESLVSEIKLTRTDSPQAVRMARKNLCRFHLVFEIGMVKNSRNRDCTMWGLSQHVRRTPEAPQLT